MGEILGTVVSGVLSGGATGLLGVLLQRWFDMKRRGQDLDLARLQAANALELRRLELDQQAAMAASADQARVRVAELDAQAREDEASARSYQASVAGDRATFLAPPAQQQSRLARWLMATVDFARGMVRPGVTLYTLYLMTVLMLWVQDMHTRKQLVLSVAQTFDLAMEIIRTITYLATTSTVWWFGVRGQSAPARK